MTDNITLLRAVGELVQDLIDHAYNDGVEKLERPSEQTIKALNALFAALAEPEQKPEPVAHVENGVLVRSALPKGYTGPLYAAPPEPATDATDNRRVWDAYIESCREFERFHGISKEEQMTREDIIRMAREAGLYSSDPNTLGAGNLSLKRLVRFAALVAEAEREACIQDVRSYGGIHIYDAGKIVEAIRARGSK